MTKNMIAFVLLFFVGSVSPVFAQDVETLPAPRVTGGKPLMDALNERKSERSFSDRELDAQTTSDLLWAAFGINRQDENKRTAPTASNKQNIYIYVLRPDGAWMYDAKSNTLRQVVKDDLRYMLLQSSARNAPFTLLYVAQDDANSRMHAGSLYQNVGLYCASAGLNNAVRMSIDARSLGQALKLTDGNEVLISQSVGYP